MSKVKSGKASSDGYKSLNGLSEASFIQDDWQCFIGFLFPCNKYDLEVISTIGDAINKKTRRHFTVIDCSLLIQEAIQLSQLNKSKGKSTAVKVPSFIEICDKVKELVDQGEFISPKIFSLLLKFKFLMIKEKAVAANTEILKLSIDLNKLETDKSTLKSPSTVGKKASKKIEIIPTTKKNTKMKLRGEETDEVITIDDEPDGDNDPDHYIIVVGITDVSILGHLVGVKVPVNAVFKINTEYCKKCLSFDNEFKPEVVQIQINDVNTVDVPAIDQHFNLWKDIEALFKFKDFGNLLCHVAILELYVSENDFPEQLLSNLDMDKKSLFAAWLFDRLSQICYKYLESYEDYQLYLRCINIIDVSNESNHLSPLVETISANLPGEDICFQTSDLRYYNKLMSFVPTQSENVNIILDCLLEQVVFLINGNQTFKENTPELEDVDELVKNYMNNVLGHIDMESKSVFWNKKEDIARKPQIVYHGDKAKMDLISIFKEENFLFKCEERMQNVHPYANLMDFSEFNEETRVEILTKRKQLFTHCSKHDINEEVFERALCQYVFESLPLQAGLDIMTDSSDEKENEKVICFFDHPYKDSQSNNLLRNLDNHCWQERFEASILYQILNKCSELRPYMKKYYCHGNNKLLLIMYNPFNEHMYNKVSWNGWLHSNVGFRSYLQSIANDVKEWLIKKKKSLFSLKEEQIDKVNILVEAHPKDKSSYGLKTRAEINTENQLIKDVKELEVSKSAKKLTNKSPELKKAGSKSEKLLASKTKASEKQLNKIKSAKIVVEHKPIEQIKKDYDFYGYNLGDEFLHLNNECIYIFPQSSCFIKLEKRVFLNGNTCININVIKDDNNFYLEFVNPLTEIDALNEDIANTKRSTNNCDNSSLCLHETEKLPNLPKYRKNISSYSVFKARFSDGLILSISSSFSLELDTILNGLALSRSESEVIDKSTSTLNLKASKTKQKLKEEESEESKREKNYFLKLEERKCLIKQIMREQMILQSLYLTVPDGLRIIFLHNALITDSTVQMVDCLRYLAVRLQHVSPITKINKLENKLSEFYRCITDDGAVIKYMSNTMVEILHPNGKILKSAPNLKYIDVQTSRENIDLMDWYYTSISGKHNLINNQCITNINTLSTFTVKCLETNQLLKSREDGVIIVQKNDSSVTEFMDGTRITAYREYRDENYNDFIKIEHDKFPTVIVNKTRSDIAVHLANGQHIHASHNGEYTVSNKNLKEIKINNDGKVDIFDYYDENVSVVELNQCNPLQSMFFKDRKGNQFCVNSLGNLRVEKNPVYESKETILPRYFIINPDGSGEELHNYDNIKTFMTVVENDKKALVLKKELENKFDGTAYTFIRPLQGLSELWSKKNKKCSVIPVGLQERDFRSFRNLTVSRPNLQLTSPINDKEFIDYNGFEVRHLIKYKPLDLNIRNLIVKGINNYNKFVLNKIKTKNRFKSLDVRKNEEKDFSEKLIKSLVNHSDFIDQPKLDNNPKFGSYPIFSINTKEFKQKKDKNNNEDIIQEYAQAFYPESQLKLKKAHDLNLLNSLKFPSTVINSSLVEAKNMIKNLKFPSYFSTDEGQAFLSANSINSDQCEFETPNSIASFNEDEKLIVLHQLHLVSSLSNSSVNAPIQEASLREVSLQEPSLSSANVSIQEAFLREASLSFNNITNIEKEFDKNNSIYSNNSKGIGPKDIVDKEFAIKKTFGEVKVSLEPSHNKQLATKLQGFIISPDFVDFGILTEGNTYMFPISIKNVGLASARFSIKQPPPSTGLKLVYNHGPVAAGMSKEINLEIFAVAVGVEGDSGIGQVYHKLDIVTELGTISVPVIATIITQNENFERERPSKGTISLSNTLSSREKITRPFKT